jgi:hypothetical protein
MAFFVTAFNIMRTELTPISRESACGAMRGDEGATQYHGRVSECLRCSADIVRAVRTWVRTRVSYAYLCCNVASRRARRNTVRHEAKA